VVDDDPAIRGLLQAVFRRTMAVECVGDGAEALARLQRQTYSVIILDLMMPKVDGFELLRFMAEARPAILRRVIVLTAVAQRTLDTLDTLDDRAKVWSVVRKPFDLDDLMRTVSDCVAQDGDGNGDGHARTAGN
jgi:CheY-like chemotaxis protein